MAAGRAVRQALSLATRRVFFALWPDAGLRASLAQAARRMHHVLHGRRIRDENLHLTLAFIGAVDAKNLPRLLAPPAGVFTPAFPFTLDDWGCWARNGIGWAAPSHIPAVLLDLAGNLEGWLRDGGFELERRPFMPHVTLVRDAQCMPLPESLTPIEWRVREFVLMQSQLLPGGARYEILHAWPLE
jgi:RNA 2',3'-cyclic 3'-phosphodiesterase